MREQQRGIHQRLLLSDVRIVDLSLSWTMVGEAGMPATTGLIVKAKTRDCQAVCNFFTEQICVRAVHEPPLRIRLFVPCGGE